jgi:hypothetical protein
MPAHDDLVGLRETYLRVGICKPETSFRRLRGIPLHVIPWSEAVEVFLQQVAVHTRDFKRSDSARAHREEICETLVDRRQVRLNDWRRYVRNLYVVDIKGRERRG